jgi:apolipoprotein N-acyltransferase
MQSLEVGVSKRDGLLVLAAGALGALAFPPLALWPLALVSVCLFLWVLREKPVSEARNLGLVYGIAWAVGTMYWFIGIFGYLAVSLLALMAGYFGVLGHLIGATRGMGFLKRSLCIGLFAAGVEWLRGDAWYLRFPWYTVPHALAYTPAWVAPVRFIGCYGLTVVVWMIAGWGALGDRRFWLCFLLLPLTSLLLPEPAPAKQTAVLIQVEGADSFHALIADQTAEPADLAVLPEYSSVRSPQAVLADSRGPRVLVEKLDCPVVFGAVEGDFASGNFLNVAVVVDREGRVLGRFVKQRPVPLFRDGKPGFERPVFRVGDQVLGVAICYDMDAPAIASLLTAQGASVLVVPTFDALPWGRIQHVHHEQLLRLRAVENDRWILRAVSSGRSEAIDPLGRPSREGVEIGQTGSVRVGFAYQHRFAPGGQLHWLGPLACIIAAVYLAHTWGLRSPIGKAMLVVLLAAGVLATYP